MTRDETLRQASAALQAGQFELAARRCEAWLRTLPRDAAVRHLLGRSLASLGRLAPAAAEFRRALAVEPGHFPALADLGVALAALGDASGAATALEGAVRLDDRAPELHFALGQCRLALGQPGPAAASFQAALARHPGYAEAYGNLGVAVDRLGNLAGALRCFETAVALAPGSAALQRNLADALQRSGRAAEAVSALERAAALAPADVELRCQLAETLLDAARSKEALAAARAAVDQAPRSARAQAALGMALLASQNLSEAAAALQQALTLEPSLVYAAVNLGEALRALERLPEAAAAYRSALRLDARRPEAQLGLGRTLAALGDVAGAAQALEAAVAWNPADPPLALTVAPLLEDLGQPERAAGVLREAASRSPASADLAHAEAALWHRRGRLPEAVAGYERALALEPGRRRALLDRGAALESQGRLEAAVASFEAALAASPDAEALAGLVSCAFRLCDWAAIDSALARLEALPDGLDALHPFLLIAAGVDAGRLRRVFERRAARLGAAPRPVARPPGPGARLRVAYVSPDFREHPVAHALVEVIERHARERLEVIGVSLAAPDGSEVGARLRAAFDVLIDASALSDRAVIARLRELEVDVAVDLAGFTVGARTGIFAGRCAPVQVNFLGFPSTMGASFMDVILADEVVVPPGAESTCSERVIRLPDNYLPMDASRRPTPPPSRAVAGLPVSGFVFCGFNNPHKITRPVFAIWLRLLRDVGESVLWLRAMHPAAADNLRACARDTGIDPDRLVLAPHVARMDDHLARLSLADLFLDTLPYNAHTTAGDALLAGVPVLSCRGATFASRVGASLLRAVGLEELVCTDLREYERRALELATTSADLRRLRERLAAARGHSALFDTQAYARNLERLYFEMVREAAGAVA